MQQTMTVTEFKAKCLDVLKRLGEHKLDRVTVTRHGKAVALVTPLPRDPKEVMSLHGAMAGQVIIPAGFDLTAPVFEGEMDAEKGILHR
jgi:antitoxin (DNA-binding transcriptional repressor) of toxin-antitoxin stability system